MVDLEMEIKGPISKSSEKIKGFKKSIFTAVLFLAIVFLFYAKNQGLIGSDQVRSSKPNNDEEIPKNEIPRSEEDVYKNKNICETRECKILARKMKSHMNPKIDPCDDFYESICGNYPENLKSEIFENKNENYKEFATFMKTYKPITRAEKIAMKVMEKCMDSSEERKQFDTSFWDNLQNHSLTDVLIEAVKINPIDTGFLKNNVKVFHNPVTNSKSIYLYITQGLEKNSEIEHYHRILQKNKEIQKLSFERLETYKDSITFIDLMKYVDFLVPEEYREMKNHGEVYVDIRALLVLQEIIKVDETKETIKNKWKSTIEKYLVTPEFESCFQQLITLFPGTLANIFVKNFVDTKNLHKANQIFKDLQQVFIEMLKENDWLDEELKDVLKQEVLDLKASIGIPDEHKDQENIDKMYSRIGNFENQTYLSLIQNLLKMNSEETFLRVARREGITYLGSTMGFNAHYYKPNHRTTIGPLLLNFPLIDRNLPEWNHIATLGYLLGHEIGHAFDANDFFINQMRNGIEMSAKMEEIFEDRVDCIIQKYDKYQFPDGSFSSGTRTQTEDSADMIGFNLAYRLFKKLNDTEKLPSFEKYTFEQQYFHRLGYIRCFAEMNNQTILLAQADTHSAHKFRVNGMMSNSEEFAKAFNCPKNSAMNPEKKCPLFK